MTDADLAQLLRSTTHSFEATLHATLAGDQDAAREALRGSTVRRSLIPSAQAAVEARVWVPRPTKTEQLEFVGDLARLGDLVDQLARHVAGGGDPHALSPTNRMTVAVLLDAGGKRLRNLASGSIGPSLDRSYGGCGRTLFEVADRATDDSSPTAALCAAMAVVLLQASRHASRAA